MRLAQQLGEVDVDAMMRRLTPEQFAEHLAAWGDVEAPRKDFEQEVAAIYGGYRDAHY